MIFNVSTGKKDNKVKKLHMEHFPYSVYMDCLSKQKFFTQMLINKLLKNQLEFYNNL